MPLATDPKFRIQVILPSVNGLSRDDVVHDFYAWFDNVGGSPNSADWDNLTSAFTNFYTLAPGGIGQSIGSMISAAISRTITPTLKGYLLPPTPGPLGAPVRVGPLGAVLSAPPSGAIDYPEQVAIVMSYRGDYGTDTEYTTTPVAVPTDDRAVDEGAPATHLGLKRPRNSDRGRVFLGPLNSSVFDVTTDTKRVEVGPGIRDNINSSATHLALALKAAAPSWHWIQWSGARWAAKLVTEVSVDDRPDTQRRRLTRASVRTRAVVLA